MKKLLCVLACVAMPVLCPAQESAEEGEDVTDYLRPEPGLRNILEDREQRWNKSFRTPLIEPPDVIPADLAGIQARFEREIKRFIAEKPEYYFLEETLKKVTQETLKLLGRYYSLQLRYAEVCYGVAPETPLEKQPEAMQEFRKKQLQDTEYLAYRILIQCVWCRLRNLDDYAAGEQDDDALYTQIENMPHRPHLEQTPELAAYLENLLKTRFTSQSDMHILASEAEYLRDYRLYDLVNMVANQHFYVEHNTLTGKKWAEHELEEGYSKEDDELAARLIVQQFDAWGRLVQYAAIHFITPPGTEDFYGSAHHTTMDPFYANQEAFLRAALNYNPEDFKKEPPENETTTATQETPTPANETNSLANSLLLLTTPVWAALTLLLGIIIGRRISAKAS